jgi:hypothetical protein
VPAASVSGDTKRKAADGGNVDGSYGGKGPTPPLPESQHVVNLESVFRTRDPFAWPPHSASSISEPDEAGGEGILGRLDCIVKLTSEHLKRHQVDVPRRLHS